jgi:RNase P/RNase MRP subunit p30
MPVRSILKNTRFALTDEKNDNDEILKIEEREKISPRKIITTTITEEYRRIQRKVVEEFTDGMSLLFIIR